MKKTPIWCLILIIFGVVFFLIHGLSWSDSSYPAMDYRIVWAINQAKAIMTLVDADAGNYDELNCGHADMKALCEEIDKMYWAMDGKEPVIVHDVAFNSQTICIYSPLNREGYWYCIDSMGNTGYSSIDPGSSGYCVEGESAVCPPLDLDM